jgi:hypothetical protein
VSEKNWSYKIDKRHGKYVVYVNSPQGSKDDPHLKFLCIDYSSVGFDGACKTKAVTMDAIYEGAFSFEYDSIEMAKYAIVCHFKSIKFEPLLLTDDDVKQMI